MVRNFSSCFFLGSVRKFCHYEFKRYCKLDQSGLSLLFAHQHGLWRSAQLLEGTESDHTDLRTFKSVTNHLSTAKHCCKGLAAIVTRTMLLSSNMLIDSSTPAFLSAASRHEK